MPRKNSRSSPSKSKRIGVEKPLNDRERLFCAEYLTDLNGQNAAIRAGYSPKSAAVTASRLLIKAKIKEEIQRLTTAQLKKVHMGTDEALAAAAHIARSDPRRLFTEDGRLKPIKQLEDGTALAISSIKVVEKPGAVLEDGTREIDRVHEIKFWDKNAALDKLFKHLALAAPERHEIGFNGQAIPNEIAHLSDKDLGALLVAELGEDQAIAIGVKVVRTGDK